jgi:hypothetical protein
VGSGAFSILCIQYNGWDVTDGTCECAGLAQEFKGLGLTDFLGWFEESHRKREATGGERSRQRLMNWYAVLWAL